ncbi:MAG: SWIM zinc finger family protein [Thermoplasmata archaeon]
MGWGGWAPYVPVARRRAQAAREMERLQRKGMKVQPVQIVGRQIAHTFWGEAWCDHLEKFSDYENRLPRGRSYVRNGAVCHLDIHAGRIAAKVSGSALYDVAITIRALPPERWRRVRSLCVGKVSSALELLQGRLSDQVMSIVTDQKQGLFPAPKEMTLSCSCPDWAEMCKHVAAVLYGVGARLDESPELLFLLRGVDYNELVSRASVQAVVARAPTRAGRRMAEDQLGEVFGIDLAPVDGAKERRSKGGRSGATPAKKAPPAPRARGRGVAPRRSRDSSTWQSLPPSSHL